MKKPKLLLILFAFLAFGQTAWAQSIISVNYVDENGVTQPENAISLDQIANANPNGATIGTSGFTNWYVLQGSNVVMNGQLGYYGGINLILCDGAKLTVNNTGGNAIQSLDNTDTKYTLTIYVQEQGTGQLVATASGDKAIQTENLTIHGGVISATGGAHGIYAPASDIIINGGAVTASAPSGNAIEGYNVTINGGIVSATGNGGIKNGMTGITTLGYTNNTDRITATSYLLGYTAAQVKVREGQYMITDNGVIVYGSLNENKRNAIAGHTLSPYIPTEWEGSGDSADDPYIIASVDNLNLLSLRTNGSSEDYSGKYFRLDANLDFSPSTAWNNSESTENNFTAIAGFNGHFNGNSHTISGLRIFANDNYHDQNGLFTNLGSNAYIENLTISNARIAGQTQVGAIAGYVNSGATITNCHVTGTVAVHAWGHTLENHGGIVGINYGTISNCVSEATISRGSYTNDNGKAGGIAGANSGTLSGNKVFNVNITAGSHYGAIAGLNDGGTLTNNYYRACTVNGTTNATGVGCNGADVTTNDGALSLHTITKPNDVTITTNPTLVYGGTNYWKQGTTITLSGGLDEQPTAGWQKAYFVNNVANTSDPFTPSNTFPITPARDIEITIGQIHADWATSGAQGTEQDPYLIYFPDQLDLLATRVNNDNTNTGYAGKYFKLMNNLEYNNTEQNNYTAIGNWNHQFKGCFDGDYKTISGIRIYLNGNDPQTNGYQGIFGYIRNGDGQVPPCEVKNLTINDADITANSYAGGIVGFFYGGKVTNCHATSTVFVRSASTGVQCHGGIVGTATAIVNAVEISHCTSSATLTNANNSGTGYGAIVGSITNGASVSDNFAIGATVCSATNSTYGAIVGENYQSNYTLERNYYHNCTVAGEVNTITKGCQNANVTANDGALPVFTLSVPGGVTATATATVTHNETNYYYKEGIPVTLSGGLDGTLTEGRQEAYVVYGETLIGSNLAPGHEFEMQNANAVVTIGSMIADWAAEQGAGDTEENPYKIYYTEQLDLLATRVNGENYYSGKYFKLMNNLTYSYAGLTETGSNYTPIGVAAVFKGHFDGNGKTISGIRIYLPNDSYRGLFGRINENAEVKNLTLTDAVITAKNQVGGIVGTMDGGTVTNCCVTSSVTIRAVVNQANYHGGIVGEIYNSGSTISQCTSSATLTIENSVSDCSAYGAIVGYIHANASVRDNFAIGATVPETTKMYDYSHGAIVGEIGANYTLERNYYHNCKVASASVTPSGVGRGGSYNTADITEEDGAMPVFTLSLASGISADVDTALTHNEVNYYKLGTLVTLSNPIPTDPGYHHIYSVNGTPIEGDTFNMEADAIVTVALNQLIDLEEHQGTEADPYLISNFEQWNQLATRVNGGTNYDGQFFKLMEDITVTNMVGTSSNKFSGTFDGNGHTLTFNQNNATEQYIAPFRYINNATIQNLKVAGTITSSNKFAGGVVAHAVGSNNAIINCVNSTIINATASNGSNGGILGQLGGSNYSVTISGCLFNGKMLGTNTDYWCGIIGYYGSNSVTINNCFFNPEEINVKASDYNYTICRPGPNVNNCYYNTEAAEMSQKQGKLAHSINGGENVTVENAGTVAEYDVSGITGYGTGIKYSDVLYAGNGDAVSLTLGYNVPGYTVTSYTASAGTLTGSSNSYTLTMPNDNVTITATVTVDEWEGTGVDWEHAYQIWNSGQLDLLASRVNSSSSSDYNTKYYKLMADITYDGAVENNYTTIGTTIQNQFNHSFSGHFDGQGHTVSGINSVSQAVYYNGLFGKLESGAEVKNVVLANCNIGDGERAGGIAGWNKGTVTNCHVNSDVTVKGTSAVSAQHGGIVGANEGTVSRCVFEGTLTKTFSNPNPEDVINAYAYGGIVGINNTNGTLSDNFVAGAVIPATMYGYGAVVGLNSGALNRNYYIACTVNSVDNATNVGYATVSGKDIIHGDLAENDGAIPGNVRTISGYGSSEETDWAFIASPFTATVAPNAATVENVILSTEYDLYRLNPSNTKWENWKEHTGNVAPGFSLENGRGYLYATQAGTTIKFIGENTSAYNLDNTEEVTLGQGFNLVGNPFPRAAYIDKSYYKLNAEGSAIEAEPVSSAAYISPCNGVIVQGTADEVITFTTTAPDQQNANNNSNLNIALTQANTRSNTVLDNAIVSFNEGSELGKFYFGHQDANIYIPRDNKEYAIVSAEAQGEIPVCFKARENGEYTLTISSPLHSQLSTLNFTYLRLIDNLTGSDVDLLVNPSYTFTARNDDYESRFRLVFVANNANLGGENNDDFAFFSNGQLIVTGEGTLQIIDMVGRVISTEIVNGTTSKAINAKAGVYVLRLITGENVKTQKIVVR